MEKLRNERRQRESVRQAHQPLRTGRVIMPFNLREIERQVMCEKTMLGACLLGRDLRIAQRELLEIVDVVYERIMIMLRHPGPKQMEQDLGVLRIVLVPGVVHGFACTGDGQ